MKKTSLLVVGAAAALSLFSGAAQAQAPGGDGRPPWIVACEGDMNKLCAEDVKNNGDVRPCLAKNEAGLSQACKDVFLRKYKILESCKDDIAKVCGGTTDGKVLKECFQTKQDQLSDKCKSALSKGSKEHQKEEAAHAKAAAPADKAAAEKPAEKPAKAAKKSKKKPAAE